MMNRPIMLFFGLIAGLVLLLTSGTGCGRKTQAEDPFTGTWELSVNSSEVDEGVLSTFWIFDGHGEVVVIEIIETAGKASTFTLVNTYELVGDELLVHGFDIKFKYEISRVGTKVVLKTQRISKGEKQRSLVFIKMGKS